MAYTLGQRGSNVVALQKYLRSKGLYDGAIDGIYGPKTLAGDRLNNGLDPNTGAPAGPAPTPVDPIMQAELAAQKAALDRENARIAEQRAIDVFQRNQQRSLQMNDIQSGISAAGADQKRAQQMALAETGAVEASRVMQEGNTRRTSALERATMQNQITGSGLGLSGVREGAEGRKTAQLTSQVGAQTLAAQQQKDSIARAAAERQAKAMADMARLKSQNAALVAQYNT